jgi:hypothetical protein
MVSVGVPCVPSRAGCTVSAFVAVEALCLDISRESGVIVAILVLQISQGDPRCGDSARERAAFLACGTGLEYP